MSRLPCPFLDDDVECPEDRERHITERHPDLLPGGWARIEATLADPDEVRLSVRFGNARLFSRWYDEVGKYIVLVVISEPSGRNWVVIAYMARKLAPGEVEWNRI